MTDEDRCVSRADQLRAGLALQLVAAATGVERERIDAPGRLTGPACKARWLALYLCHVAYGWTVERVGHVFGVTRNSATRAFRWVEDARDRPALDGLLDALETCVRDLPTLPARELGA